MFYFTSRRFFILLLVFFILLLVFFILLLVFLFGQNTCSDRKGGAWLAKLQGYFSFYCLFAVY